SALFFFSSRRRHTRFSRDWSSDVCSSDLSADHAAVRVRGPNCRFDKPSCMRQWAVMRAREQTFLTEMIGPEDRAIEAVVSRYQRVAPAVTRLARSLSGNQNLRVRLGSEASASEAASV